MSVSTGGDSLPAASPLTYDTSDCHRPLRLPLPRGALPGGHRQRPALEPVAALPHQQEALGGGAVRRVGGGQPEGRPGGEGQGLRGGEGSGGGGATRLGRRTAKGRQVFPLFLCSLVWLLLACHRVQYRRAELSQKNVHLIFLSYLEVISTHAPPPARLQKTEQETGFVIISWLRMRSKPEQELLKRSFHGLSPSGHGTKVMLERYCSTLKNAAKDTSKFKSRHYCFKAPLKNF